MRRSPKLAEQVARSIEDEIIALGWPVGASLGGEAELIARYAVSRATLREAVTLLEYSQIATMRRGRGGGLVVKRPAASVVARTVASYFYLAGVSVEELFDTRVVLQVLASQLAARRITERDIRGLRDLAAEGQRFDERFEVALGSVTRNDVLAIFIPTLTRVTGMLVGSPSGMRLAPGPESGRERAWRAIIDAVVAGDEAIAERRMRRHLDANRVWVTEYLREHAPRPRMGDENGKLAEITVMALADEIRGREPGHVIGGEAELVARLGVGRSAFRQAVRILEHHGVVQMREGAAGGLVVTTPDPHHVVEALALYLHYIGVDVDAVFEVRTALELEAVAEAARVVRGGAPAGPLIVAASARLHPESYSAAVHLEIAELAGSRLTELFIDVLVQVQTLWLRTVHYRVPERLRQQSEAAHRAIVEAVREGDASLARHRMARHLSALRAYGPGGDAQAPEPGRVVL